MSKTQELFWETANHLKAKWQTEHSRFAQYFTANFLGGKKVAARYHPSEWAFFAHGIVDSDEVQRTNNISESTNNSLKDFIGVLGLSMYLLVLYCFGVLGIVLCCVLLYGNS